MNRRVLMAGSFDTSLGEGLKEHFDVRESKDIEDTQLVLINQYRMIKVVLISIELFCKDNYHIINEMQNEDLFKHIPFICIGSIYEDTSKLTLGYHDALDHGALGFYASPFDIPAILKHINNIISIKEHSENASIRILNDATKNYETNLSGGTFWNPKSLDSIIMRTAIGATCLIESVYEKASIVRISEAFFQEIFGRQEEVVDDFEYFFDEYLDSNQQQIFRQTLKRAIINKDIKAECSLELKRQQSQGLAPHIRMVMRTIDKQNERALIYCMIENDMDKYYSIHVEKDLMNQMQMILKNLNYGITIGYDDFGNMKNEYSNDMFYSIFGYTKEEFEEEKISVLEDLLLPEYLFEAKTGMKNASTQRRPVVLIAQARKKGGTVIWVKFRCSVYFMKAKGKSAYIITFEDITTMKAMEDRLLSINERLTNSEVYFQLDLTNRVVEDYHSDFEPENNNLPIQNRIYQKLLLSNIYEEDKEEVEKILSFENLLKSFYEGNTKISVEYRRRMPDGTKKWFAATAIMVIGKENDIINAFIYIHDIDLKMKTRLAKDRIVDSDASDITIINIASGMCRNIKRYDSVVSEVDSLSRFVDDQNLSLETEVAPEDRERCRMFFRLANMIQEVKQKKSTSISFWTVAESGISARKNTTVTFLDSTEEDLLVVGRDITELFEKEQEQQMALENAAKMAELANQAKTDFLSRMSHDMRTPLNAILGLSELAQKESQISEVKKYINDIDVSGHFLLSLINDTLDLSKIESGKMELHREPFPLEEFKHGIETMFQPLMEAKNIQFEVNLQEQISNIAVDKIRFNQIFYNLLSNAVKYTPEGGNVEIFSESIEPKDNMVGMRFHVRDNGIGMSKEYQKVIFEPFSQEYNVVQKEQKGTGLGLAIVKQIVELAQGDIQVISEPGQGTEFIVDLYAYRVDEIDTLPVTPKYDSEKLRGLHILLADDTEINFFIVKRMLEFNGCIVDAAANGQEALHLFENSKVNYYDIILTDIRMPVMDGFEEATRIRALERADAKTIPIIAATADAYDDIKVRILEAGMNERLVKPIEADQLCMAIISLIEHKQTITE